MVKLEVLLIQVLDGSGTEGLFAAIESRGNVTSGVSGVNAATDLAEFDAILAEFDKPRSY